MEILEKLTKKVKMEFPKEYACHVFFVHKVAMDLWAKKGGDKEVIELASTAHDIGRVEEGDNTLHPEIGSEKIFSWLKELGYDQEEKAVHISRCILMHNKTAGFQSIEEEIVCNADCLSKLLYLDMFMLMCKKEMYIDRAKWGLKYIEKCFNKLTFSDIKESHRPLYENLKQQYEGVINRSS